MNEATTGADEQPSADTSIDTGVVRRRLVSSMAIICWGAFFAGGGSASIDPFGDEHRTSINLVGVVGTVVLLVGLSKLPVTHLPGRFRARRNVIIVIVALALGATAGTRVLPGDLVVTTGAVATWLWALLLIDLVRRLLSHLGALELAAQWRRVIAAWITVGVASVGLSAIVRATGAWSADGKGWQVFSLPAEDHPYRWWFIAAVGLLWIATAALFVVVIVVGVRTMRWLRANVEPPSDGAGVAGRGATSASPLRRDDMETAGGGGDRLRDDGDRVIYLVDPADPR